MTQLPIQQSAIVTTKHELLISNARIAMNSDEMMQPQSCFEALLDTARYV